MSGNEFKLNHPPVVEAIIDFDCEMPLDYSLADLRTDADKAFLAEYPERLQIFSDEFSVRGYSHAPPELDASRVLSSFRYISIDKLTVVQVRPIGFSFNRLAPYRSLDDYLPEIQRAWHVFAEFAKPLSLTEIKLRYINLIRVPEQFGKVSLNDYFKFVPQDIEDQSIRLDKFLVHKVGSEQTTANLVKVTLTDQPMEQNFLPIILDIETSAKTSLEPGNWEGIRRRLGDLRSLKNKVFEGELKPKCISLFQ